MLRFEDLWNNHPYVKDRNQYPCDLLDHKGDHVFEHQCAIKLGTALWSAGMHHSSYTGKVCWKHGRVHPLAAEELAHWLQHKQHDVGQRQKYKSVTDHDFFGKTGIMLCKDFWGTHNQGDHIDLWDGTGKFLYPWDPGRSVKKSGQTSFAKGENGWIAASKEVWFWQLL